MVIFVQKQQKSGNCDEREVGADLRQKRRKNVNRGSVRIFNEPSDLNFFVEFFLKPLVPPGKRSNFQRSLLKIAFKKNFYFFFCSKAEFKHIDGTEELLNLLFVCFFNLQWMADRVLPLPGFEPGAADEME